ncbi:MAG: hypothetical protein ACI9AT_000800, partial [Ulvibacter sp.]
MKELLICFIFLSAMNTIMAQDWADLNRFKQANAQLSLS